MSQQDYTITSSGTNSQVGAPMALSAEPPADSTMSLSACRATTTMPETMERVLQMTTLTTTGERERESCCPDAALVPVPFTRACRWIRTSHCSNSDGSYYYSNSDGSTCELAVTHALSSLPLY